MKKTYKTKPNKKCFFRIGKALIRIEFDENGEYSTDNPTIQQAIENSHSFKEYSIQLKQEQ